MKRLIMITVLLLLLIEPQSGFVEEGCSALHPHCPTNTPCPTDTPIPPTNTPCPTDTPIPPTDTPLPPTDTPVSPTRTPSSTSTPTPESTGTHCPTPTPRPKKTPIPPTSTPMVLLPITGEETVEEGRASQYAESVMQRVVAYRQRMSQIPQDVSAYGGFIAVRECADIGKAYYIRPAGAEEWDYVLAADCASKSDRQSETDPCSGWEWMRDGGIRCEISHPLAVKWNTVGRMIRIEMIPYLPKEENK